MMSAGISPRGVLMLLRSFTSFCRTALFFLTMTTRAELEGRFTTANSGLVLSTFSNSKATMPAFRLL